MRKRSTQRSGTANTNSALSIVRKFDKRVKRVIDARAPLVVQVTGRDANSRAVKNHGECAMAVAIKRQEHATSAIVSRTRAYVIKGDTAYRYTTGPSVSREVTAFDRGSTFEPGDYKLTPPAVQHKLGAYAGRTGKNSKNRGIMPHTKRFRHVTENIRANLQQEKA